MSKNLSTLVRLHQYRVDEKRRSLAELLGEISNLETKDKHLQSEIISEQAIANSSPDSVGMFYGIYAEEAVNKRRKISEEINDFEEKVSLAQEEIRDEYRDLKIFEITLEKRKKIIELENAKVEQVILDELGQETYRRRQK